MPGADQVRQIISKLISEDGFLTGDDLGKEVSSITSCSDIFECGGGKIVNRHMDMDFIYGDYPELREGGNLFQFICALYRL